MLLLKIIQFFRNADDGGGIFFLKIRAQACQIQKTAECMTFFAAPLTLNSLISISSWVSGFQLKYEQIVTIVAESGKQSAGIWPICGTT